VEGSVKSYEVTFKGKRLSVDAIVTLGQGDDVDRVRLFNVREVSPHGYLEHPDDPRSAKAADRARTSQTHHSGEAAEGHSEVAFSSWPEEDTLELARLVRAAAR
jgi:hypothetical protein